MKSGRRTTNLNRRLIQMKSIFTLTLLVACFAAAGQTVSTLIPPSTGIADALFVSPTGDIYGCPGRGIPNLIKITPDGELSIFATGLGGPNGVWADSKGNFFTSNYRSNNINKITPSGEVSIFASNLNGPAHLVINDADEIFVTEFGANFSGTGSRVLKFSPDGAQSNYLSEGGLLDVVGIVFDDDGNLYLSNWSSGQIFKSTGPGDLTPFADIGGTINQMAFHGGFLYVPSPSINQIFRIDMEGNVVHFAGTGRSRRTDGPAPRAAFPGASGLAFSPAGDLLYVNDQGDGALRVITLTDDIDGDGIPYNQEAAAGTDHNDSNSFLHFLGVERVHEGIDLRWSSVPGKIYTIQHSMDFQTWDDIATTLKADTDESSFIDPDSTRFEELTGFYRVGIE